MTHQLTDERGGFTTIQNVVFTHFELKPHEMAVYMALCFHANKSGESWPGLTRLQKETRMSRNKLLDSISALEEKKLIRVQRTIRPNKKRETNHYFIQDANQVVHEMNQGSSPDEPPPSAPDELKQESSLEQDSKNNIATDAKTIPEQNGSTPSKPRERNLVFDAVAEHVFGIQGAELTTISQKDAPRIGIIASWLQAKNAGPKNRSVGKLSHAATPEQIRAFRGWYRATFNGSAVPRDIVKFAEHWRAWASSRKKSTATPPKPSDDGLGDERDSEGLRADAERGKAELAKILGEKT